MRAGDGVENVEIMDGVDGTLEVERLEVGQRHHESIGGNGAKQNSAGTAKTHVERIRPLQRRIVLVRTDSNDGSAAMLQNGDDRFQIGPVRFGFRVENEMFLPGGKVVEPTQAGPGRPVVFPCLKQATQHVNFRRG